MISAASGSPMCCTGPWEERVGWPLLFELLGWLGLFEWRKKAAYGMDWF